MKIQHKHLDSAVSYQILKTSCPPISSSELGKHHRPLHRPLRESLVMTTATNMLQSEQASLKLLRRILLDFATVILCAVRNAAVNDSTACAYLERVRFVNIAMNLNTILEMTEESYWDTSYCTTFKHVCSEFLLLCESLISDDALKKTQYYAQNGAGEILYNKVCVCHQHLAHVFSSNHFYRVI